MNALNIHDHCLVYTLSFQNRKQFYNAYILPHFDLCCASLGNCTSVIEDKLVKLQKGDARAILDVDFTVHSETMFTQLKWMTFPERVVYHKTYKCTKQWCTWLFKNRFWFYIWDSFMITQIIFQCSALYTKTQQRIIS